MVQPSSAVGHSATFFLPLMIFVIIELGRIGRDIDLSSTVKEDHSALLLSGLVQLPFQLTRVIFGFAVDFIRIQTESIFAIFSQPTSLLPKIIAVQIQFLEFFAGRDLPEEIRDELEQPNRTILTDLEARLEIAESRIIDRIDKVNAIVLKKLDKIEGSLVPSLGRFALIHSLSFTLLVYVFIVSFRNLPTDLRDISLPIIILVWAFLPVLEVEEYDMILSDNQQTSSLLIHILATLFYLIPLLNSLENGFNRLALDGFFQQLTGSVIDVSWFKSWHILVIYGIIITWAFLKSLELEIRGAM